MELVTGLGCFELLRWIFSIIFYYRETVYLHFLLLANKMTTNVLLFWLLLFCLVFDFKNIGFNAILSKLIEI